jgi:hypothetical protein
MSEPESTVAAPDKPVEDNKPQVTTLKDLTFYAPPEVPDKARYIGQVKEYLLGSKKAAAYNSNWPEPSNTELLLFLQVCKSSGLSASWTATPPSSSNLKSGSAVSLPLRWIP